MINNLTFGDAAPVNISKRKKGIFFYPDVYSKLLIILKKLDTQFKRWISKL